MNVTWIIKKLLEKQLQRKTLEIKVPCRIDRQGTLIFIGEVFQLKGLYNHFRSMTKNAHTKRKYDYLPKWEMASAGTSFSATSSHWVTLPLLSE